MFMFKKQNKHSAAVFFMKSMSMFFLNEEYIFSENTISFQIRSSPLGKLYDK